MIGVGAERSQPKVVKNATSAVRSLPLKGGGLGWGSREAPASLHRGFGNPLTPTLSPKRVEDARKRANVGERELTGLAAPDYERRG
jgi:hypothetical protein